MCLQLERWRNTTWEHNMEYGKRKAGYIFYLYRLCLKTPQFHPVPDVYS